MRDTKGNIMFLTDTDLRRGRERVVVVGDKDDNVLQIDNLRHILNPFHGAAVILAGLFGEQEVSHSELVVVTTEFLDDNLHFKRPVVELLYVYSNKLKLKYWLIMRLKGGNNIKRTLP